MNKRILPLFLILSAVSALAFRAAADESASAGKSAVAAPSAAAGMPTVTGAFAQYPASLSGDYAVYRDWTWESPTWIGFLYYNDSTWGAFKVTPSTGSKVSLLFSAELIDGEMVLTGQNIISNITPDDVPAVNYLMKLLPDMYGWRYGDLSADASAGSASAVSGAAALPGAKARSALLPPAVREDRALPSFGGDVHIVFAPEVPVFCLQGITGAEGKPVLELVRAGRIQSGGDGAFFDFTPMPDAKAGTALSVPASRKTETKTVDGVKLKLDGQWTMYADNTFFLGNAAVIIVDTLDLSLMQIPRENLVLSLVRMFSLSGAESWAIPSELIVSGTAKKFTVTNLFFDSARGVLNRDIKTCIPSADGKTCVLVSLSVSETAYQANKAYFGSIVE